MERRLRLHEKIKSSPKLNKMTVKQGDVLVTLNLKQDIGDPNVEISDKVLYMLEQFVEKQQSKQLNASIKAVTAVSTAVQLSNEEDTLATIKKTNTPKSVTNSPSKRVRFDLNLIQFKNISDHDNETVTVATIEKNEQSNTIAENNNNDNQPINLNSFEPIENQPISKLSSDSLNNYDLNNKTIEILTSENNLINETITPIVTTTTSIAPKSTTNKIKQKKTPTTTCSIQAPHENDEDEEEQNLSFNCRLCRLKFNNQRGLHEHVARSKLDVFFFFLLN